MGTSSSSRTGSSRTTRPRTRPAGETVVEAVFGSSSIVQSPDGPSDYGAAGRPDRAARGWSRHVPNPIPVVKVGDWIADVTYERSQNR